MTARPIATKFSGHGCTDKLTTEHSLGSQATGVIDVLGLYGDVLSMGVCTTGLLEDVRSTGARFKCLYCSFGCTPILPYPGLRKFLRRQLMCL